MRDLKFTDYGTVKFDGTEKKVEDFLARLEHDVDQVNADGKSRFTAFYKENEGNFAVRVDYTDYQVVFNNEIKQDIENGIMNPITKRLMSLANINQVVNNDDSLVSLSAYDKEVYLRGLKRHKPSYNYYLKTLFDDIRYSKPVWDRHLSKQTENVACVGLALGISAAFILGIITGQPIYLLMMFSSIPLCALNLVRVFVAELIKRRFECLKISIAHSKKRKQREKCLEESLKKELAEKETNEVKVQNLIPRMVDSLIESLKAVDFENRGTLTAEVKAFLLEYQKMIEESSKTDRDLALENSSITKKIADLQLKIAFAKRKNVGRKTEVEYLISKVEGLEEREVKPRVHRKA